MKAPILRIVSATGAYLRRRLQTLCSAVALGGVRREFVDGYLLLAKGKNGSAPVGTLIDLPQYILLVGLTSGSNTGVARTQVDQTVSVTGRDQLAFKQLASVNQDVTGRSVVSVRKLGSSSELVPGYWSVGVARYAGTFLLLPRLYAWGDSPTGGLFDLPETSEAAVEIQVVPAGTSIASYLIASGVIAESDVKSRQSNNLGIQITQAFLTAVAPGYSFLYFDSSAEQTSMRGGYVCEPIALTSSSADIFAVVGTGKPDLAHDGYQSIPGLSGALIVRTLCTFDDENNQTTSVVYSAHFNLTQHPTVDQRPIAATGPAGGWWYNNLTVEGVAAFTGGVASLMLARSYFRDLLDSPPSAQYKGSTLLMRLTPSGASYTSIFESNNAPALGRDLFCFASYSQVTDPDDDIKTAFFHVLRGTPSDVSEFAPDSWVLSNRVLLDDLKLVTYSVTGTGSTSTTVDCSAFGYVPIDMYGPDLSFFYDDYSSIIGRVWRWKCGTSAAALDAFRIAIPVRSITEVLDDPPRPGDSTSCCAIYDRRTGSYAIAGQLGVGTGGIEISVLVKAELNAEGNEVRGAVLLASITDLAYIELSGVGKTKISYDSGATWQILLADIAPGGGAYFIGNVANISVQGHAWR